MSDAPRPVYVVGAGRLGGALLLAWRRAGVPLAGAWTLGPEEAAEATVSLGLEVASGPELPADLGDAHTALLAVPDDVVTPVAAALAAAGGLPRDGVLLHVSGALDAGALAPAAGAVAGCGSLHPLQTVPDPVTGADALRGAWAALEGDPPAVAVAQTLAEAAGLRTVRLPPGAKARYHAAAVLACNDLVALLDLAAGQLVEAGLSRADADAMLLPLARATLDNVAERGAAGALTGPVRRGDAGTVRRHLEALAGAGEAETAYRVLGRAALALAGRAEPPPDGEVTAALRRLLDEEPPPI